MSSVLNFIKKLPEIIDENNPSTDINYIRKSTDMVNEALSKGHDVLQLANGDILITEVVTNCYSWNKKQNKFERSKNKNGSKREQEENF
jgi:hypothetical protein